MPKVAYATPVDRVRGTLVNSDGSPSVVAFDSRTTGRCLHQYIKTPNPRTLTQTSTRAFFASAVAAWSALDTATANTWRDAAALIPWYDRMGFPIQLSGKNFWVKVQTARLMANFFIDPTLPLDEHLRPPTSAAASVAAGILSIPFTSPAYAYNQPILFRVSRPLGSAARNATSRDLRLADHNPYLSWLFADFPPYAFLGTTLPFPIAPGDRIGLAITPYTHSFVSTPSYFIPNIEVQ